MLADRVREARASGQSLRIVAGQTWLDAGRPVAASDTLSLAEHRGILEYVPGDLTLTARAATPMADLYAATKAQGQWLPLDPWGGDSGSIGATITTATAGPHAHAMGLPRDVVLGLEFISGAGDVIRAGGRVVKNVAGFDLTRLLIGSWGTLGVVTEVTVRLRARPPLMRTVALSITDSASTLNELAIRLRALPFTPLAAELVNAVVASALGVGKETTALVRLGGNAASVARQLDLLRALGSATDAPESVWSAMRHDEPRGAATWRSSRLPSVFGEAWTAAVRATRDIEGTRIHGSIARGVVRACAPSASTATLLAAVNGSEGNTIVERLPADAWASLRKTPADELHETLRRTFDPDRILNPGIMGAAQ
jgi:glycolate oxidase FAD binding subunit